MIIIPIPVRYSLSNFSIISPHKVSVDISSGVRLLSNLTTCPNGWNEKPYWAEEKRFDCRAWRLIGSFHVDLASLFLVHLVDCPVVHLSYTQVSSASHSDTCRGGHCIGRGRGTGLMFTLAVVVTWFTCSELVDDISWQFMVCHDASWWTTWFCHEISSNVIKCYQISPYTFPNDWLNGIGMSPTYTCYSTQNHQNPSI